MKKILLLIITLLILCSCQRVIYEDTNGDDNYSLETLKEEDYYDSHSGSAKRSTGSQFLDKNFTYEYEDLNGIMDIVTFEGMSFGEAEYTLKTNLHVSRGNGKFFITTLDNKLCDIEINKDNQEIVFTVKQDTVYLVAIGESLDFTLEYEKTIK